MIVRHEDAVREYAHERNSPICRLARALDDAPQHGGQVISIRGDWPRLSPEAGGRG